MARITDKPETPATEVDFAALFGDGAENCVVELMRVSPKFYQEIRIEGFCQQLAPGVDRQWIKENFGGGLYRIVKRVAGKFADQVNLQISGYPKIQAEPEIKKTEIQPAIAPAASGGPAVAIREVDGISIGVSDDQFIKQIRQLMMVKAVLKEDSVNDRLLEVALSSQGKAGDSLSTLREAMTMVQSIKELFPDGDAGGEGGVTDLIREGLRAFTAYMSNVKALPSPAPAIHLPGRALKEIDIQPSVLIPPAKSESEGNPLPNFDSHISQAVAIIVQNYRLHKPVERVITLLNQTIPLPQGVRKPALGDKREALFDLAETNILDVIEGYEEDLAEQKKFADYFYQVFDGFVGA